jgi:peptidoglycan/xylan/chitin deacetylase (PgdA/CDA1 family)
VIVNLCFHGIGVCIREREPGEAKHWVKRDTFLRLLDLIHGRPEVRLSFDDGNKTDVELGLPALVERELHATFFPLAGRLGKSGSLDSTDLQRIKAEGMDVGSHGWCHIPWRRLSPEQAGQELVAARAVLSDAIQEPVDEAAVPLGQYDRTTLRLLREAGYRTVYTSDRFPARPSSWLQARFSITANDTVESVAKIISNRSVLREARAVTSSMVKRNR